MSVNPVPDGYHSITPYICAKGAAKAIDYYKDIFGATELMRMGAPDGKIGHAELKIGDSVIMIADEFPPMGFLSPETIGGSPVVLHIYVDDVDSTVEKAVATGSTLLRAVEDQFYGDRSGQIKDPFGHLWNIGTHKEDLTPEEIGKRAAEKYGSGSA